MESIGHIIHFEDFRKVEIGKLLVFADIFY
jgi:hypothetical protein